MSNTTQAQGPLADDLLIGIEQIAGRIGQPAGRVRRLVSTGALPGVFRMGGRWAARESTILKAIERMEQGAAA